jgi:hypothetical protein
MNLEKSKIKADVTHALGCQMDDQLESAEREIHKHVGGSEYLSRAAAAITSQAKRVDDDLTKGDISEEIAHYAKKRIEGCLHGISDLIIRANSGKLGQEGIVAGIKRCVSLVKKSYDAEASKIDAVGRGDIEANKPRTSSAVEDLRARKAAAKKEKEKRLREESLSEWLDEELAPSDRGSNDD